MRVKSGVGLRSDSSRARRNPADPTYATDTVLAPIGCSTVALYCSEYGAVNPGV
jgi:hypothetical protein